MASSEDDVLNSEPELEEDDLFGDEADEEPKADQLRELDDEELDSGDDENRQDRRQRRQEDLLDEGVTHDLRISEQTLPRHPLPKPVDGELNSLRLPKFLGIEPHLYTRDSYKVKMTDHHSNVASANFSASATAATTMRHRKDAAGNLESNTIVYKWSDGSTTICVGDQHYELQTKPLAPPRDSKPYLEVRDSHSYLATPSMTAQLLGIVGHMTNEYTVRPNKDVEDDALDRLQKSLAAAARKGGNDKNGPELIVNQEDPELQKKRAEMAEKEQMRLQRRRETAAEKANQSGSRRGAGILTVDDLEGGRRRGPNTGRKPPGAKRPRRRPEYDSDDDLPRGKGREDEYDKEDDFLASSDEEIEEGGADDDEEEEMLEDESDREEPKAKKQKTSKSEEVSDADADGEADLDDDEAPAAQASNDGPAGGRGRKRNVIEDDEDDE